MLSVSRIKAASRAAAYYGRDDYYVTGEVNAPGLAWGGNAAARLGLEGPASAEAFNAVLSGGNPIPDGPPIASPDKEARHHPGWDFTFSAPKSISVAILVGGDSRLDAAHDRAVAKAMDYAERRLSYTRVRDAGARRERLTGNLLYASTVHGVSRSGDPQRHTHVVIANATYDERAGAWRALESRHLYKRRMLLGKIYQAELAREAMTLGYDVRAGRGDGLYELDAWTREQLQVLAKRTQAIVRTLAIEKPATPAARETVKLKNRPDKIELPREELVRRWKDEAHRADLDVERVTAEALARDQGRDRTPETKGRVSELLSQVRATVASILGGDRRVDPYAASRSDKDQDVSARAAVSFALQVGELRSAVFTRHEVIERALDAASPTIGLHRIEADLTRLEKAGDVIRAERELPDGVATRRGVAVEAEIIDRLEEGRARGQPIASQVDAVRRLNAFEVESGLILNAGQRLAALTVLTTRDRHVAVQGTAGVGKTTMLSAVRHVAQASGREIIAITPTHRAAMAMKEEAGVHATTVAAWLATMDKAVASRAGREAMRRHWKDRSLVIDEASMVSNAQLIAILGAAEKAEIRSIILLGDARQLGSPEAGAPFRLLLNREMDQARMSEILRQRDPTLRESVQALAEGRPHRAVAMIEAHIREIGRGAGDSALAEAAVAVAKAAAREGVEPRIIVPTNVLRGEVAERIRAECRAAGLLAADGKVRERYQQVRLDGPERFAAKSYRLDHRLVLHGSIPSAGLRRGDEADIVGLDLRNDVLRVRTSLGDQSLDLRAMARSGRMRFSAYVPARIEVAQGEQLVWERAEPKRGFLTGAGFTVVAMDRTHWTIRHEDGREERLRADDPALRFIGYAYAETADRAQGQTYRSVVAVLSSQHGEAVSAARQYVMQSRPSQSFQMITDDRRLLMRKLAEQDGLNRIALENLSAALAVRSEGPEAAREAEMSPERTAEPAKAERSL